MKVLLVTREYPPYVKGGMSRVAQQLAARSSRYDIDLTIIANYPGFGKTIERTNGVKIYRVPWIGSTFLSQLPTFGYFASSLLKNLQDEYDLVYSNYTPLFCKIKRPFIVGFQATRLGESLACKESNKPVHALMNRLYIPLDKALVKKADAFISLSEEMNKEIIAMGCKAKRVKIIPNGVDTDIFRPTNPRDFTSSVRKILYVGRLDSRKGLDTLFYAVKEIGRKIKLIIAGAGREQGNLQNLANSLVLPVDFLGQVPHESLPEIYNKADLFVLPSMYEGMPLSALEAMACATPTIISDGSPDLGVPQFKRGRVDSLAKILTETLSTQKSLKELSQSAFSLSRKYDWKVITNQIFSFLREIA